METKSAVIHSKSSEDMSMTSFSNTFIVNPNIIFLTPSLTVVPTSRRKKLFDIVTSFNLDQQSVLI